MASPSAGQLEGRVVLVTGAACGIGRAVVESAVAEGARVVMLDLAADPLGELAGSLGDAAHAVVGDVRDPHAHEAAVAAAAECFGGLDVLIGNAGVFDGSVPLAELDSDALVAGFDEIFAVNVLGYLQAARAALSQLRARRGTMVFTVSNAGFHPGSGGGALYTASKHAVVGLIRQLAYELAPEIRVNGVAPGGTMTDLRVVDPLAGLAGRARQFANRAASEAAIRATNPLKLVADPADHAAIYLLLAGSQAPAITGEVISSDGGLAVRGIEYDG